MSLHRIIIMHDFALNIKVFLTYIRRAGRAAYSMQMWYSMVICLPVFLGGCIVECSTDNVFGKSRV